MTSDVVKPGDLLQFPLGHTDRIYLVISLMKRTSYFKELDVLGVRSESLCTAINHQGKLCAIYAKRENVIASSELFL